MKRPNPHRTGILAALTLLLAGSTTGLLPVCEPVEEEKPQAGATLYVTLEAGEEATDINDAFDFFSRIALCDFGLPLTGSLEAGGSTIPSGVYLQCNRDLRGEEPLASVDLKTNAATPPGHYLLQYRMASLTSIVTGTLDLTVQPAQAPLVQACLYVYGEGENPVIVVNQNTNFYGCCSLSPENDLIVQYKWWWDYNGNPLSAPSLTTTLCLTDHTYTSVGPRTTRLVVRTQSGEEAEDTQEIVVLQQ